MKPENFRMLERRIAAAAHAAVAKHQRVTSIDVMIGIGWLAPADVERWRRGQVPYLERVATANLKKLGVTLRAFRRWAGNEGLSPRHTAYRAQTRDRRQLRFSKSGDRNIERAYSTHWVKTRS